MALCTSTSPNGAGVRVRAGRAACATSARRSRRPRGRDRGGGGRRAHAGAPATARGARARPAACVRRARLVCWRMAWDGNTCLGAGGSARELARRPGARRTAQGITRRGGRRPRPTAGAPRTPNAPGDARGRLPPAAGPPSSGGRPLVRTRPPPPPEVRRRDIAQPRRLQRARRRPRRPAVRLRHGVISGRPRRCSASSRSTSSGSGSRSRRR
jgi:hypothetical protein